jgi:hypothetical protein
MFTAIEDIPTEQLLAELERRQPEPKPMRYLVWSDHDPNDSFEVDAVNVNEAAWAALGELGWCVSAEPHDEES